MERDSNVMATAAPPPMQRPDHTGAAASAAAGAVAPHPTLLAAAAKARTPASAASEVNKVRIAHVAGRLALHLQSETRADPYELFQLCFSLARGIDYAVSHSDVPPTAHELPPVIKQVYQHRSELSLQPAVLVLLISAKNACRNRWFDKADSDDILNMTNEISSNFCMASDFFSETSNALQIVSKVMSRFYPLMKLSCVLASFEVKQGYEILVSDLYIPRNIAPDERIRLFVVQTDNLETSSCIISPQQVNFLVNGRGVEKRTNVSMDNGPQFPSDITKMLKYGMNLFQAIGSFGGNYVISIAVMTTTKSADVSALQDYIQSAVPAVALDSEIIEGPSRISLNCPISFKRIKTPVKGYLCKHHQCFDFNNFMDMNSRKPSWRCLHCNQPVSYVDLRIDRHMLKILEEVGDSVSDVIISADGTWKVAEEHNNSPASHNRSFLGQGDGTLVNKSNESHSSDIVDLTMVEDHDHDTAMSSRRFEPPNGYINQSGHTFGVEDRKHLQDGLLSASSVSGQGDLSNATGTAHAVSQVSGETWSRMPSVSVSNWPIANDPRRTAQPISTIEPFCGNLFARPDIPSLPPSRGSSASSGLPLSSLAQMQSAPQALQTLDVQLQQPKFRNSIISNDVGRPLIPRNVTRTPVAIQALPAQSQYQVHQKRARTDVYSSNSIIPSNSASLHPPSSSVGGISRVSNMVSPTLLTSYVTMMTSQVVNRPQQIIGLPVQLGSRVPPEQVASCPPQRVGLQAQIGSRVPSEQVVNRPPQIVGLPAHASSRASPDPLRAAGSPRPILQSHQTMSQIASAVPQFTSPPARQPPENPPVMASGTSQNQHDNLLTTSRVGMPQAGAPLPRTSRVAEQVVLARTAPPHSLQRSGSFQESPSEQNWKPTGRMRGSLTGSAYSEALNRYVAPPAQPMQAPSLNASAAGSSSLPTSSLPTLARSQSPPSHQNNRAGGNSANPL